MIDTPGIGQAFSTGDSFLMVVILQTTVLLIVGLGASLLWSRRPARAHCVLVLAIGACFLSPVLTLGARSLNWGLFSTQSAHVQPPQINGTDSMLSTSPGDAQLRHLSGAEHQQSGGIGFLLPSPDRAAIRNSMTSWILALSWLWALVVLVGAIRLVHSFLVGQRLVRSAKPLHDSRIERLVAGAAKSLGLDRAPTVLVSHCIACPVIWCWGRVPTLLLPGWALDKTRSRSWHSIILHEVAHLKRRDHLSSLAAELLVCAMPWHPVAWCARRRQRHLAEQACDDWALASGGNAPDYAESLLALLPQLRPQMALAAVSTRSGLAGRIHAILSDRIREPQTRRSWVIVTAIVMVFLAACTALAQTRQERPPPGTASPQGVGSLRDADQVKAAADVLRKMTQAQTDNAATVVADPPPQFVMLVEYQVNQNLLYHRALDADPSQLIGHIPYRGRVWSAQRGPTDTTIIGVDREREVLVTIDVLTFSVVKKVRLDTNMFVRGRGLAVSPGGTIYGVFRGRQLRTIDPETGRTTLIGTLPKSIVGTESMTFAPDGTLYAAASTSGGPYGRNL